MAKPISALLLAGLILVVLVIIEIIGIYILAVGAHALGLQLEIELPILAISGVLTLLISLAIISVSFAHFSLADKSQALALPEGSVRAVMALSLVVLFSILSIFLYGGLSDGQQIEFSNLTRAQKQEFLTTAAKDQIIAVTSQTMYTIVNVSGAAETSPEAAESFANLGACVKVWEKLGKANDKKCEQEKEPRFTVYYRLPRNQAADDFAKQLLVLIGTLVTSVTGFYFGSKAASSGADGTKSGPAPSSVSPAAAHTGSKPDLTINGDNLNLVYSVKLVHDNSQIVATGIVSNSSVVKCSVEIPPTAPAGSWDVVVTDTQSKQAILPGAFAVTAAVVAPPPPAPAPVPVPPPPPRPGG